jgi:hypothetical protein
MGIKPIFFSVVGSVLIAMLGVHMETQSQTVDLDKLLKEAQTQKAVFEAQKAAEDLRKAKAEADKAASEAENAKANQAYKQSLDAQNQDIDLQTKIATLQAAKQKLAAEEIKQVSEAFKLPDLTKVAAPTATPPKADVQIFLNASRLVTNTANEIVKSVIEGLPNALACTANTKLVLLRDTPANRGLLSSYSSVLRSVQYHREYSDELSKRGELPVAATISAAPPLTAIATGVNLIGSALQIAAALRPTLAYGSSTQVGQFNDAAIFAAIASPLKAQSVSLVDLQESSAWFQDAADQANAVDSKILKEMASFEKSINKLEVLLSLRQTELAELQKSAAPTNLGRIAVLQPLVVEIQSSVKKSRDFLSSLIATTAETPLNIVTKLQGVESFFAQNKGNCTYWISLTGVTMTSDIQGVQPALSRQRTFVKSAGGATWSIYAFSGQQLAGGVVTAQVSWDRADPL